MVIWKLSDIYPFEDTQHLLEKLTTKVEVFAKRREELTPDLSPERFLELLKELESIHILSSKLSGYANLWLTENTADDTRNAHAAHITNIVTELGNTTMFFGLWFKALSDREAKRYLNVSGPYRYHLESIRRFKQYTLSEQEEQAISLLTTTGSDAIVTLYDIVTNRFRFHFQGASVSQAEVIQHYVDPDPDVRVAAYSTVLKRYKDEQAILGEMYKTIVRSWWNENVTLRKFTSPLSVRNVSNDIPDVAVHAMLTTVKKNSGLFQEYFRMKQKLLKAPRLDRFHIYAPIEAQQHEYTYDKAMSWCFDTYKRFDPEMERCAQAIVTEDHIHSDLTPNKQSGAFCYSILPSIRPYLLLNFTGKLEDVFTMMHELGHGIHSVLAHNQTPYTFHASLPLAETASIFGELLLLQQLLKTGDAATKRYVLAKQLDKCYGSIVRQSYFVMFEEVAHRLVRDGCTIADLNAAYQKNLREQFGPDMHIDALFEAEWNYIPHIHHTPFYCYAYAFGNLLVLSLYKHYENEGTSFIPKYLNFLRKGGSAAPTQLLADLGIDCTKASFWESGFDVIREQLETLKRLL